MEINAAAAWLNSTFGNLDVSVALAVHKLYDIAGGFFNSSARAVYALFFFHWRLCFSRKLAASAPRCASALRSAL